MQFEHANASHWPPMNEYTVYRTFASTACYWGYLAAANSCNMATASSTMRSPVPGSQ